MSERRFGLADAGLAFLIGALTGVGAVLLLRSGDDDDEALIRRLRHEGVRAHRAPDRLARDLGHIVELSRRVRSMNGS